MNAISLQKLKMPFLILAAFSLISPVIAADAKAEAVSLNNEGVAALKNKDTETAISKFKFALFKCPGYKLALDNLATAYFNSGVSSDKDLPSGLRALHMAAWLAPTNKANAESMRTIIRCMGKNPESFEDRISLGDEALKNSDFAGAITEYQAALAIKKDPSTRQKLESVKVPGEWNIVKTSMPVTAGGERAARETNTHPPVPAAARSDVDFGPYMATLQKRIKKTWLPPRGSESQRVMVIFKVHKDGKVTDVKLSKPSGFESADIAALAAVNNAAPLDTLPEGSPPVVDIQFTFDYNTFKQTQSAGAPDKQTQPSGAPEAQSAGAPEGTEQWHRDNIASLEKSGNTKGLPEALVRLGEFYVKNGKTDDSISPFKRALDLLKNQVDNKVIEAQAAAALGQVYYDQNRFEDAARLYRRRLEVSLYDEAQPAQSLGEAYRDLAYALLHSPDDHFNETLEVCTKAVESFEKASDQASTIDMKSNLGLCYYQHGDYEKARAQYAWVVSELEKKDGNSSTSLASPLIDQADCEYELKHLQEALSLYKRAIALAGETPADQDEIDRARGRITELCTRLNLPTPEETARASETEKSLNNTYSWLPYALGGALLSLLIVHFVSRREKSAVDIPEKKDSHDTKA